MGGLLKIADVASLLNVSHGTVRRWIEQGHLVSVRTPGGQYRIPEEAAQALAQPLTPKPATEAEAAA